MGVFLGSLVRGFGLDFCFIDLGDFVFWGRYFVQLIEGLDYLHSQSVIRKFPLFFLVITSFESPKTNDFTLCPM